MSISAASTCSSAPLFQSCKCRAHSVLMVSRYCECTQSHGLCAVDVVAKWQEFNRTPADNTIDAANSISLVCISQFNFDLQPQCNSKIDHCCHSRIA